MEVSAGQVNFRSSLRHSAGNVLEPKCVGGGGGGGGGGASVSSNIE